MKLTLQLVCCILIWECVFASRLPKLKLEPACLLKPEIGPCKALLERYYYDKDEGKCKTFNYGGCEGNGNNFQDEENCLKVCTPKATEPVKKSNGDICSLPRVRGPCEALIERYYYNTKTKQCQQFLYGGCQGNENNFKTLEDCKTKCVKTTYPKIEKVEPLTDLELKIQPDIVETKIEKIEPFEDFKLQPRLVHYKIEPLEVETEKETERRAEVHLEESENESTIEFKPHPRVFDVKIEPIEKTEKETERRAEVHTHLDETESETEPLINFKLHPNRVSFKIEPLEKIEKEFETKTEVKVSGVPSFCTLSPEVGSCKARLERYYYDAETSECKSFDFGGCEGNGNNFLDKEDCLKYCTPVTKTLETKKLKAESLSENICSLPRVTGPCRGAISRYYYNPKTKLCQNFLYGGCLGNENNFETSEECEKKCL